MPIDSVFYRMGKLKSDKLIEINTLMRPDLMNIEDDTLLLLRLSEGCRYAFDSLYQKYWKLVLNAAYKRLKDAGKAEDIAQDVFTQLWLRGKNREIKNLQAYLFTAVRNNVFTLMTRENRYVPVTESLLDRDQERDGADAELLRKEFIIAYEAMIDDLPDQQRIIFRMRYHEEFSTDEIALKLKLSPKTVRNHLGRAIATLRTSLILMYILMFFK